MIRTASVLVLAFLAAIYVAPARGRSAHIGRLGLQRLDEGARVGRARLFSAYAVAEFTSVNDLQKLKDLSGKLAEGIAPLGGRVLAEEVAPTPLDGAAPNFLILIGFDDASGVAKWRQSQSFKDFDASAQKLAAVRIFEVAAAQDLLAHKRDQMRAEHERADQNLIKMQDQTLKKLDDMAKAAEVRSDVDSKAVY